MTKLKGKVVVLVFVLFDFEIPQLMEWSEEFGDGLQIVAITDSAERARDFAAEHKPDFPIIADAGRKGAIKAWNVDSWTTWHIVDQAGIIRYPDVREDEVRDAVWKLLNEK